MKLSKKLITPILAAGIAIACSKSNGSGSDTDSPDTDDPNPSCTTLSADALLLDAVPVNGSVSSKVTSTVAEGTLSLTTQGPITASFDVAPTDNDLLGEHPYTVNCTGADSANVTFSYFATPTSTACNQTVDVVCVADSGGSACEYATGITGYETQCAGSTSDESSVCTYDDGSDFKLKYALLDSECGATTGEVSPNSGAAKIAYSATERAVAFRDGSGNLNIREGNDSGGFDAAVDLGIFTSSQFGIQGLASGFALFTSGTSVLEYTSAGGVIATYRLGTGSGGDLRRHFAYETGGDIHGAAFSETFSFQTPKKATLAAGFATKGTGTIDGTSTSIDLATWTDDALKPIVDVAQLADGALQAWVIANGQANIAVTNYASGTLVAGSPATVTTSGGTITKFLVSAGASNVYMVALVDIAGTTTLRAYPFSNAASGSLDLTGGTLIASDVDSLDAIDVGSSNLIIGVRVAGKVVIHRVPHPSL